MQKYNERIYKHLKNNNLQMIKNTPQVENFNNQIESLKYLYDGPIFKGGIRNLAYCLPGNNVQSNQEEAITVDKDVEGGRIKRRGRPKRGGSIWDDISNFTKTAEPYAKTALEYAPYALPLLAAGIKKPKKKYSQNIEEIIENDQMNGCGIKKRGRGRPRKNQGGNFLDDAYNSVKNVSKQIYPYAKEIGKEIYPLAKDLAIEGIKSYVKKGSGLRKPTKRNLMVKQLMMKHNMTLPEASKYIKQHNLA